MLLIWLLLIPSAATADCSETCNLCDEMKNIPQTAACILCRECMKSQNHYIKKQKSKKQALKLEKRQHKQVIKDLLDNDNHSDYSKEETEGYQENDDQDVMVVAQSKCPDTVKCIEMDGNHSGKQKLKNTKPRPQSACATAIDFPSPISPTTKRCPTLKPCNKPLNEILNKVLKISSTSIPPNLQDYILKSNMEASNSDFELDDQGCPTQPICSDEEDYQYAAPTTNCPKRLVGEKMSTTPCAPCKPYCPLPCELPPPLTYVPPLTYIPPFTYIPKEAIEALLTLKPTSANNIPNVVTTERIETVTNKEIGERLKETTKEYMYFYVGIPKDVRNVRRWSA